MRWFWCNINWIIWSLAGAQIYHYIGSAWWLRVASSTMVLFERRKKQILFLSETKVLVKVNPGAPEVYIITQHRILGLSFLYQYNKIMEAFIKETYIPNLTLKAKRKDIQSIKSIKIGWCVIFKYVFSGSSLNRFNTRHILSIRVPNNGPIG